MTLPSIDPLAALPDVYDALTPEELAELEDHAEHLALRKESWRQWLARKFPKMELSPFAPHHVDAWNWIDALTIGTKPLPLIICLARGGGKSTTVELGTARVCDKLSRRYVLYLCGTQENADKHIRSIATLLESIGVQRSLNRYGHARGWRRQELRASNGFNVAGFGLDSAIRGIKIDDRRPDWIILDDIDDLDDTIATIDKKIQEITRSILPSGSNDCAVSFVQNVIHRESVMSRLIDGRADFLRDRGKVTPIPALLNPVFEELPNGKVRIASGTPTWEGQGIEVCEAQANEWGLASFKAEAQHDVYANVPNQRFDNQKLQHTLDEIRSGQHTPLSSIESKRLLTEYPELRELVDDESLVLWETPREGTKYCLALDVAGGLNADGKNDYCCLQILNADEWTQAGRLRGNWEAHELAQLTDSVASLFGGRDACLVVVLRLYGQATLSHLIHDHKWPKRRSRDWGGLYYYESSEVKENARRQTVETIQPGFPEDVSTKPIMISALADAITDETPLLRDEVTVMECLTYVKLPGGKTGGMSGANDDTVSSLAVGTLLLGMRYERRAREKQYREETEEEEQEYNGWNTARKRER